mmetsp:Transcript_40149/g.86091  ORF Transcript_40149/g.86091 Transcript_40149/m.86091 type:complete len:117 (+) Transcript_40149:1224-1574(+)
MRLFLRVRSLYHVLYPGKFASMVFLAILQMSQEKTWLYSTFRPSSAINGASIPEQSVPMRSGLRAGILESRCRSENVKNSQSNKNKHQAGRKAGRQATSRKASGRVKKLTLNRQGA